MAIYMYGIITSICINMKTRYLVRKRLFKKNFATISLLVWKISHPYFAINFRFLS